MRRVERLLLLRDGCCVPRLVNLLKVLLPVRDPVHLPVRVQLREVLEQAQTSIRGYKLSYFGRHHSRNNNWEKNLGIEIINVLGRKKRLRGVSILTLDTEAFENHLTRYGGFKTLKHSFFFLYLNPEILWAPNLFLFINFHDYVEHWNK